MNGIVLRSVTSNGRQTSVRIEGGQITELGADVTTSAGDTVIEGMGGGLIPGLHDHHIHLAAIAAADRSLHLDGPDLDATLREHAARRPAQEWIRAVGYDEHASGPLDRHRLDTVAPGRPVRVQHRSGAMWVLSSAALSGLDIPADLAGVERDADDEPTGRLFRLDDWLRDRLPPEPEPDIAAVTRRLASYGITGVTDATPFSSPTALELLARPDLAVRVTAMGGPELTGAPFPERVGAGPVKIVVGDDDLPSIDAIAEAIATAHGVDRPVAVHCVTRAALVLTLAALDTAGSASGDRIEHGAVISPELRDHLAGGSLTVVTQPGFIAAHGDRYREQVDADDLEHLYPCRSLLDAGIEVGGSTDAPFGPEDPWWAIRAAIERRTASGAVLGPDERISPVQALHMWLSRPERPGGPSRHVERGGAADLCLLDAPFRDVIDDPQAGHVRAVICRGEITYSRA